MMQVRSIFVLLLALAVCFTVSHGQATYRFSEDSYTGYEGSGRVRVQIVRGGDTGGSGSVSFSTFGNTATAGNDYITLILDVDFLAGQESRTVDIELIEDNIEDGGETFSVRLRDPTDGNTVGPADAVVSILDGDAPSTGLELEILIAIIVACVAAVLILLICCILIYCLRFRGDGEREDVVYLHKPPPEHHHHDHHHHEPEFFIPPPQPRPYTPPQQRPYTPPFDPPRPRTPPPAVTQVGNPNTQVMVINEPSPPIIEPPPPKPTQVIVIRPQTPEIIRRRPQPVGQTEVIVNRDSRHHHHDHHDHHDHHHHRRPRSASPILIEELPSEFGDRPPSPVTVVRRVIRRPLPLRDGDRFGAHDDYDRFADRFGDRYDDRHGDRYDDRPGGRFGTRSFRGRDSELFGGLLDRDYNGFGGSGGYRFGGRDALLNLPPGLGLYGPSNPSVIGRGPSPYDSRLPQTGFRSPGAFDPVSFGPASFGPAIQPSGFGPSRFGPSGFQSGFGGTLPPPAGFGSGFGRPSPPVFGSPPPPSGFGPRLQSGFGPQPPPGFYGQGF